MKITVDEAYKYAQSLIDNVCRVFIGKREVVVSAVLALLAEGHILLEDFPGVGKTLLAKSLAKSIDGVLKRIQFTADLLPTDVSGVSIFLPNSADFSFRKGPVFSNILLGDEINRATPRTQSSLLEAMEEYQVTVDGNVYELDKPFLVIATQNPIELEGTYPLPFSQMDRFIVRLNIGYLDHKIEKQMLKEQKLSLALDQIEAVLDCDTLVKIQKMIRHITISEDLYDYIIDIIHKTRDTDAIEYGVSPRGALDLMRFSQASAFINGRDYVLPDDIKQSAAAVLGHRIIVKKGTRLATSGNKDIIEELIDTVKVPV